MTELTCTCGRFRLEVTRTPIIPTDDTRGRAAGCAADAGW